MNSPEAGQSPSRMRRILGRCFRYSLVVILLLAILVGSVWIYYHPEYEEITGVVYGQRHGKDLLIDVIKPEDPNGAGILLVISGRWRSRKEYIDPWPVAPLLRRGYTLFLVRHVSQPESTVMETVQDIQRAARFIRYHAKEFGIDGERLGVTGGSSGGHLSLMLATTGGPGDPEASDPIDRESSAVQAAAVFYPVTDLLNLGDSRENLHDGGPPRSYVRAFGMSSRAVEPWLPVGRSMSPIFHVTKELPPILIYHGTADDLVPLDQSTRFQEKARSMGLDVEVITREGKGHGWPTMLLDAFGIASFYDRHLVN
jgi:acetyl esterase/lipase